MNVIAKNDASDKGSARRTFNKNNFPMYKKKKNCILLHLIILHILFINIFPLFNKCFGLQTTFYYFFVTAYSTYKLQHT